MFHTRRRLEGRIKTLEQQCEALSDKIYRGIAEKLALKGEIRRLGDELVRSNAILGAVRAALDPPPVQDPTPAE